MSEINQLKVGLSKMRIPYTALIQHSYNPYVNSAIQYYVLNGNDTNYIISTYRKNSNEIILIQNGRMKSILNKIKSPEQRLSVLFSCNTIKTAARTYRLQKYVPEAFVLQLRDLNVKRITDYLKRSSTWLKNFQSVTASTDATVAITEYKSKLALRIDQWIEKYYKQESLVKLLQILSTKLNILITEIPQSAQHGDYCMFNVFFDSDNKIRIKDWEFAVEYGNTTHDHLTNLFTLWRGLHYFNGAGSILDSFFYPKNEFEKLISNSLNGIEGMLSLDPNQRKLMLVVSIIKMYLRKERPQSMRQLLSYLPEVLELLEVI